MTIKAQVVCYGISKGAVLVFVYGGDPVQLAEHGIDDSRRFTSEKELLPYLRHVYATIGEHRSRTELRGIAARLIRQAKQARKVDRAAALSYAADTIEGDASVSGVTAIMPDGSSSYIGRSDSNRKQ